MIQILSTSIITSKQCLFIARKSKQRVRRIITSNLLKSLLTNQCNYFNKMSNVQICQFEDKLVEELKKFRFSKSTTGRAIVMKIDTSKMQLVIEEQYEDTTIDELR